MIADKDGNLSFRQSWIGNAINCPEQARLGVIHPERDRCSDEAFIGTAAHAGIEAVINGTCAVADIADAVVEAYRTDPEAKTIYFARPKTHQSTIGECIDLSVRCAQAWVKDILPHAPLEGARTEVGFDVDLFEHNDRIISIKGTVDLVPAKADLWDWKTSARDYSQKDKQKWAIQPTVYGLADVMGGLGRYHVSAPTTMTYGIMVKLKKECRGQMITVQRDRGHFSFLEKRLRGWADMYDGMGMETPWPMIEDGNYLCSKTWCGHYDQCRGAHISMADDLYGYEAKAAWKPKPKNESYVPRPRKRAA
jgi:hypothetical protein